QLVLTRINCQSEYNLLVKMEMNYRFLKSENKLKKISVDLFEVLYMINNMTPTYYIKMSSFTLFIVNRMTFFIAIVLKISYIKFSFIDQNTDRKGDDFEKRK